MTKVEFIQEIGNKICDGCGPDRDCELEIEECPRIKNAIELLDIFISCKKKMRAGQR